jgi:parallel beta-helix repeat protein
MVRYLKGFIDTPPTIFIAASNAREEEKELADIVCTGIDDQNKINQAFDLLPSTGGRVRLSEGNFNLSNSITISKSNVWLEGSGAGTVIQGANSNSYIVVTPGVRYVKISDLQIDGSQQTNGHGIYFNNNSTIANNHVVSNCWIHNCENFGIYLYYTNFSTITKNILEANDIGICLTDSIYNKIIGNNCLSNRNVGIEIYKEIQSPIGNTIIGNICVGNGAYGIRLSFFTTPGQYFNIISKNIMANNGSIDISIENSFGNIITNNVTVSPSATYNIEESNGSNYNIFAENRCEAGKISVTGVNSITAYNIQV